jgi:hypothetical protein
MLWVVFYNANSFDLRPLNIVGSFDSGYLPLEDATVFLFIHGPSLRSFGF